MKIIADLHIHSPYSMATSPRMRPRVLARYGALKGIDLIGTGDFTHPRWLDELKEALVADGSGLFDLSPKEKALQRTDGFQGFPKRQVRFMLSAEISSIYKKNGRTRKVHSIVHVSDFESAGKISSELSKIGSVHSDGRPILKLDARRLLEIVLEVSPDALVIPAHLWTPHFSVLGKIGGFDTLEQCYEDLTPYIHAVETGLSSDPPMNRRVSMLDSVRLVSNSDAHSPENIGREATLFNTDFTYDSIVRAIRTGKGFDGTIEFFPEAGKYHNDGHRACKVNLTPEESTRLGGICPVCKRKLTPGVAQRVHELSDRALADVPDGFAPYTYTVPLQELMAKSIKKGKNTKTVMRQYIKTASEAGGEFNVLLYMPLTDVRHLVGENLYELISRLREGDIGLVPGYDGEYGRITGVLD